MSNFMPIIFTQFFFIFNLNFSINYQKILNVPFTWCMYIIYIEAADQISYQKISEGFFWRVKRVINNSPTEKKIIIKSAFSKQNVEWKNYIIEKGLAVKKSFQQLSQLLYFLILFFSVNVFKNCYTQLYTHFPENVFKKWFDKILHEFFRRVKFFFSLFYNLTQKKSLQTNWILGRKNFVPYIACKIASRSS